LDGFFFLHLPWFGFLSHSFTFWFGFEASKEGKTTAKTNVGENSIS